MKTDQTAVEAAMSVDDAQHELAMAHLQANAAHVAWRQARDKIEGFDVLSLLNLNRNNLERAYMVAVLRESGQCVAEFAVSNLDPELLKMPAHKIMSLLARAERNYEEVKEEQRLAALDEEQRHKEMDKAFAARDEAKHKLRDAVRATMGLPPVEAFVPAENHAPAEPKEPPATLRDVVNAIKEISFTECCGS